MRNFTIVFGALVLVLLAVSGIHSSWLGSASALLGIVGTCVFLWGTWTIAKLTSSKESARLVNVVVLSVALLLKLPLIYVGWLAAQGLGPFGPMWFLIGLGLVYSALVWRAVLAVRA